MLFSTMPRYFFNMETEIWKDIVWFEWKYQVSNMGSVKRLPYEWTHTVKIWQSTFSRLRLSKERIMSFSTVDWYKRVSFSIWWWKSKRYLVHRLVYCSFNEISIKFLWQCSNTLVLHKNDIRDDNRLENLFLGTQKDNVQDMINKWRHKRGVCLKRKIWFSDVDKIKSLYKEVWNIFRIWEIYWVSGATISRVINNKIWKNEKI